MFKKNILNEHYFLAPTNISTQSILMMAITLLFTINMDFVNAWHYIFVIDNKIASVFVIGSDSVQKKNLSLKILKFSKLLISGISCYYCFEVNYKK